MATPAPRPQQRRNRPLSRRTTRVLVLGLVVLALAIAVSTVVYLSRLTQDAPQRREQPVSPPASDPLSTDTTSAAVFSR